MLNGLLEIFLVFVDISQVVVGIAVARIGHNSFLVPLNSLIYFIFPFVNDCCIVVGTIIFWIVLDALLVVFKSCFVLFQVIVGDPHRVINLVKILLQLICTL